MRQSWNCYKWSKKEIDYLKDNFFMLTNAQLANALGLKLTSVRTKCYELGLKRMDLEYWTEEQTQFLKVSYQYMGDTEIAEYFNCIYIKDKGWSKKHIEKKRRYLKLKRTDLEIRKIHERNVLDGRFKICPVKAWETRGGASKDGEIRQWRGLYGKPFLVIKIKTGFVHYARQLYQNEIGKIPRGMLVRLKDGNPLNVVTNNLELVSRAENAIKNAGYDYPKEIRTALRTINKIKKAVYEKQNN